MIEKLNKKDIRKAALVYKNGISLEIPKGNMQLKECIERLKNIECFVYKNKKIEGLVSFELIKPVIRLDFICSLKLRKGIGKKLIKKLADYALRKKIKLIYSNVSSKDKRALSFYKYLGFKKYGKYYANKNFLLYKIKASPSKILSSIKH